MSQEREHREKRIEKGNKKRTKKRPGPDEHVKKAIARAEEALLDSLTPTVIRGLNHFQRKFVQRHFEQNQEFQTKMYKENSDVIVKVYPVGKLRRLSTIPATSRLTRIVSLPMDLHSLSAVSTVSSEVPKPFTISTALIMGTGLKKWVPAT